MIKRLAWILVFLILNIQTAQADWTLFKSRAKPSPVRTTCAQALQEYRPKTDGEADLFFRQLRLLEETDTHGDLSLISDWIREEIPHLPEDKFAFWDRIAFLSRRPDLVISDYNDPTELGFLIARVPSGVTFQTQMPDGRQAGHPVHSLVWTPGGFKLVLSEADMGGNIFLEGLDAFLLKPFALDIAQVKSIITAKAAALRVKK